MHSSPDIKKEVLAAGALQPVIGLLRYDSAKTVGETNNFVVIEELLLHEYGASIPPFQETITCCFWCLSLSL